MSEVCMYVVTKGQAGESRTLTTVGSKCPLVANVRHCNQGRRGNKIPTGAGKRGDGGNGANLIEVTSRPSRYPQQPDMMS